MTWSSPATGKTFFETNDIPTQGNFSTYIFDNLLAIAHPYDYSSSDVDVANTVTETSIYSKVITGGDLGSTGALELRLEGDCLKNNAAGDTVNIRVKFGGVTHISGSISPNQSASEVSGTRFSWQILVLVSNRGATNSQWLRATLHNLNAGGITGRHDLNAWAAIGAPPFSAHANPTIDTTADQTLQVTVQWSAASGSNSWRKRLALLTLGQN